MKKILRVNLSRKAWVVSSKYKYHHLETPPRIWILRVRSPDLSRDIFPTSEVEMSSAEVTTEQFSFCIPIAAALESSSWKTVLHVSLLSLYYCILTLVKTRILECQVKFPIVLHLVLFFLLSRFVTHLQMLRTRFGPNQITPKNSSCFLDSRNGTNGTNLGLCKKLLQSLMLFGLRVAHYTIFLCSISSKENE